MVTRLNGSTINPKKLFMKIKKKNVADVDIRNTN